MSLFYVKKIIVKYIALVLEVRARRAKILDPGFFLKIKSTFSLKSQRISDGEATFTGRELLNIGALLQIQKKRK